jgi:hypothetical protein
MTHRFLASDGLPLNPRPKLRNEPKAGKTALSQLPFNCPRVMLRTPRQRADKGQVCYPIQDPWRNCDIGNCVIRPIFS